MFNDQIGGHTGWGVAQTHAQGAPSAELLYHEMFGMGNVLDVLSVEGFNKRPEILEQIDNFAPLFPHVMESLHVREGNF